MDLNLSNRRVLVTGSHRGTGLVTARSFLEEGADVFVHGFTTEQAEAAVAEIGGQAVAGDIRTDAGADDLVAATGLDIDILVNNYGAAARGRFETATPEDWMDMVQANVLSAQRLIQRLLPSMRARSFGRIINLGTAGALRPGARNPHYYAAKAALVALTESLADEVAGSAIRVNMVSPGMILTPEVRAAYIERGRENGWGDTWEEMAHHFVKDIPIRRITSREEVADLVLFLASPRADAIHGQNLRIDGGAT